MSGIAIKVADLSVKADLFDTPLGNEIKRHLPLNGRIDKWGNEIYFPIPVQFSSSLYDKKDVLEPGDLAFWEPGQSFCLFWGPTPASSGNEIRSAGPVEVFGKVKGDPTLFSDAESGQEINIVALENI